MRTISTVPAVLDYLYDMCSLGLPELMVTDGMPKPPKDAEPNILCIGFTGIPGEPVVENNRELRQLASKPSSEEYGVICLASSWRRHDTDTKKVRAIAYGIIDSVNELLVNDHTLGGLVMRAMINSEQYAQEQTSMGVVATVRFTIYINAVTR